MNGKSQETDPSLFKSRRSVKYWRVIKGNLYARLQYQDDSGKWRERLKPIKDKRTARSVVDEMRRELNLYGHETFETDRMSFTEFADIYRASKLTPAVYANKVKISGRKSNVDWAFRALVEHFGSNLLRSIKPRDLENFKTSRLNDITRRGTKRNIATVNRELSLLRAMLNFALQNDWIVQNPFSKVKGIIVSSAETERDRILSFEEESRLLDACVGRRSHLRPILICALDTAMRSGEIFKMKWQDVRVVSGEIHIPQTNTKTEESRIVGITPRLRVELDLLWEKSPRDLDQVVFGISDSVKRSWKTACLLASISDFRLHDCRHTATTRMIASGSPHTEVMKITGHSQLKTFLRYLNITSDAVNKVATRLSDYFTQNAITTEANSERIN
jgi:integrase